MIKFDKKISRKIKLKKINYFKIYFKQNKLK